MALTVNSLQFKKTVLTCIRTQTSVITHPGMHIHTKTVHDFDPTRFETRDRIRRFSCRLPFLYEVSHRAQTYCPFDLDTMQSVASCFDLFRFLAIQCCSIFLRSLGLGQQTKRLCYLLRYECTPVQLKQGEK